MYSKQYIYALQLMHCTRNQNDKQIYLRGKLIQTNKVLRVGELVPSTLKLWSNALCHEHEKYQQFPSSTEFLCCICMNTVDDCPHCQQTFGRPSSNCL